MNLNHEEHNDIETLLLSQPLREPSRSLDKRVQSTLNRADDGGSGPLILRWRSPLVWAIGSALAASLALAVIVHTPAIDSPETRGTHPVAINSPGDSTTTDPATQPIQIAQTWTKYQPAGDVIVLDDTGPVMPVMEQTIEHRRWIDPNDNVQIEMTVPREKIRFVAMSVD
ncbi:MAG: hypothetical protein GC159_23420 [Phycisphaera sp.]|nr:hypothetical protein [Phycisphaera sp.]